MSQRALDFAADWVNENINVEVYQPEGDNSRARELAETMVTEARAAGIARSELEETVGDLVSYVAEALEEATDRHVADLSNRDD